MAILRLFASAREAAGEATTCIEASTVDELLDEAVRLYGAPFREVLGRSRVWVNGHPADGATRVSSGDVVAVLPPVSGGASRSTASARRPSLPPQPPPGLHATGPSPFAGPAPPAPPAPPGSSGPDLDYPLPPAREGSLPPASRTTASRPPASGSPAPPAQRRARPPTPRAAPSPPPATTRPPGVRAEARRAPADPVVGTLARGHGATAPDLRPEEDARSAEAAEELPPLAVVPRTTRPHGRLGVAWALGIITVTVAGPMWLALWMGATAAAAASQAAGVWRERKERPLPAFAAAAALALPLAALAGAPGINAVLAVALLSMLLARLAFQTVAPARDVALTLVVGVPVGLAAAAPVLLARVDARAALLLLASAAVYDAGAYLVGTGASSTWEGPVAGIAALVPLTLIAVLTFDPPFAQSEALRLGLVAAVLAPFGPLAGSALLGDRNAPAPALRRIDSLLVMGPVWALFALAFLG